MWFNHKEEWNYVVCMKIDKTGDHHIKWNKPGSERQLLHVFSHIWNIGNRDLKVVGGLLEKEKKKVWLYILVIPALGMLRQ
jgi:hypothetical protein